MMQKIFTFGIYPLFAVYFIFAAIIASKTKFPKGLSLWEKTWVLYVSDKKVREKFTVRLGEEKIDQLLNYRRKTYMLLLVFASLLFISNILLAFGYRATIQEMEEFIRQNGC